MLSGARHHVRVLLISRRASHSTIARNPTTSNTFRSIESTQGPHESSPHEHPRPDSWEHRAKVVGKLHSITKPPSKPRFANAKTKPARTTPVLLSQNWQNAALEAALKAHSKGHRRIALRVPDQPQRKTELYGALLTQTPSAEGRSKYLILANSPDKMATIASELSPLLPNDKILLQWKGGNKGARLFQRVSHLPNVVMHSTGHETIYITTYRQDRLQDQLRLWRTQFATVILDDCQVPQPKGAQALFSRLVGRDPRQPFVRRVKNLEPTVYGITSVKNTAHVELKAFFDTLCYRYNELEVWRDELPRPLIFSSIRLTLDLESIRDSLILPQGGFESVKMAEVMSREVVLDAIVDTVKTERARDQNNTVLIHAVHEPHRDLILAKLRDAGVEDVTPWTLSGDGCKAKIFVVTAEDATKADLGGYSCTIMAYLQSDLGLFTSKVTQAARITSPGRSSKPAHFIDIDAVEHVKEVVGIDDFFGVPHGIDIKNSTFDELNSKSIFHQQFVHETMLNEAESAREKAKAKKQGKPFWSPETELEATLALKDAALNLQMQPCTLDFDANSQHISPHRTGPNSSTAPVTKFTEPSAKLYNQWQTTWGSKRKWYRADNNVFVLTLSTSGEMKGSLVVVCHPQISNSKTLSQAPERVGTESAKGLRENLTIKKRDDEESTPADLSDGEHSSPSSLPSTRNIDKTTHWKLFWDATPLQRLPVLPVDITLESRNRLRLIEEGTLSNVQARALTEALRWLGKSNVYSYEAATFDQNMWKNQPVPQILAKEFESRLRGMIVPIKNKDGSPISIETIVDGWMSKTLGHEVLARMTYGGRGPWIAAREWHTMFVDISKGRTIWGLQTHQRTGKKARRILKDNKVRFW